MAALSSDPAPIGEICSSQNKAEARTGSQQEPENSSQEEVGSSQEVEVVEVDVEKRVIVVKNGSEDKEIQEELPSLPTSSAASELQNAAVNSSIESSAFSATDSVTKSFTSTPGYLANRWNTGNSSFSTPTSSEAPIFSTPPM
jgi:hypothetical protein